MDLLARLYDVTAGSILLDGKDVSAYSFETLCKKIGYIPQKATLFADTVEGNVSFGNSGQKKTKGDEEGGAGCRAGDRFCPEAGRRAAKPDLVERL